MVVEPPDTLASAPRLLFVLETAYLIGLVVLLGAFLESGRFRDWLPASIGSLPVGVPWFGALGGVLISLTGIFLHRRDWDPAYLYWHVTRPLVGAVIGSIGCLILVVVVDAANTRATDTNPEVYYLAAFLVGYREETFRELIKRAGDVIFGAGKQKPS